MGQVSTSFPAPPKTTSTLSTSGLPAASQARNTAMSKMPTMRTGMPPGALASKGLPFQSAYKASTTQPVTYPTTQPVTNPTIQPYPYQTTPAPTSYPISPINDVLTGSAPTQTFQQSLNLDPMLASQPSLSSLYGTSPSYNQLTTSQTPLIPAEGMVDRSSYQYDPSVLGSFNAAPPTTQTQIAPNLIAPAPVAPAVMPNTMIPGGIPNNLPTQASPTAKQNAFGQMGYQMSNQQKLANALRGS